MELSTSTNMVAFQPGRQRNPFAFCIPVCAKGGYRVLDINFCEAMNPTSRLRQDDWESYVEEIRMLGEENGVVFRQSHLPYYDIFRHPQGDSMMELLIERSIIASGILGVRWAVTHPGTWYEDPTLSLEKNLAYYEKHLRTARSAGTGICLENDFGFFPGDTGRKLYCADVTELARLVDAFGDPEHLGACYDFGHGHLMGGTHREKLKILGPRLKAVHVHDNHGSADEHLMPFHGTTDWAEAMAGLADIGYSGELTYEIQEFGRYLPNDKKILVVEYSRKIGQLLTELYRQAKTGAALADKDNGGIV